VKIGRPQSPLRVTLSRKSQQISTSDEKTTNLFSREQAYNRRYKANLINS
jgi:hypothetical protein